MIAALAMYALLVGLLLGILAVLAERSVRLVGGSTRLVWAVAMSAMVVFPAAARLMREQPNAQRLQAVGFHLDQLPGAPVCRYRTTDGLVLDAMPLDGEILGFSIQWYPLVMDTAVSVDLTASVVIRTAHPTALLATKWEAFLDRGGDDPFGSHDLEDLLMLIAGRPEFTDELQSLPMDARAFIADSAQMLLAAPWFDDVLEGTFPDAQRLPNVPVRIRERISTLAP